MNKPIIEIKNIGKRYNITRQQGGYVALRDVLTNVFKSPFSFLKSKAKNVVGLGKKEDFWALKDISLDVMPGEVIGIIGKNGSGKSTLLKILTGITPPTEGEIIMRGRVASLLEVGTGFHPELTGRENVFLNGAILGMSKKEIARKFDEIVEFSGIGKFLDTPVKRYSSGMQVRLAFSVAAHMEPDILLIDEVLAVGDAEFQKKCMGKMEEVTQKDGRTILFVSHNLVAIKRLCAKTVLLDKGKIVFVGDTKEAIEHYIDNEYVHSENTKLFPFVAKDIVITDFSISQDGTRTNHIDNDYPFEVKIDFETLKDLGSFRIGIFVKNAIGDIITRSLTPDWNPGAEKIEKGLHQATLVFPEKLLMTGDYFFILHASCYGIVDYLGYDLHKMITVSKPTEYNKTHPDEPISSNPSLILLKNEWAVRNIEK